MPPAIALFSIYFAMPFPGDPGIKDDLLPGNEPFALSGPGMDLNIIEG
jgi:hypothetical protein